MKNEDIKSPLELISKYNIYSMIIKKFQLFTESLSQKDRLQDTANGIIKFLRDNKISTWEEMHNNEFTRNVINKIIDKAAKSFDEVREIKFLMRLELSNIDELNEMLDKLVKEEDYMKCQRVKKKIDSLTHQSQEDYIPSTGI